MRATMTSLFGLALLFSSLPMFSQSNDAVEKALQAREQSLWQAWKDHDAKPVEDAIVDPSVNIAGGSMDKGKQQIVKSMIEPGCKVASFSLSNFSFIWLDKDSVLMTYDATQDATCGDKKQPDQVYASSIWLKKGGKWVTPFHQESPAGGM